ncbi:MAG TPA: UDP-glucose/GDP-mannose dehydrogenase family protein [Candidatus Obscuribacterales bacterium]
MKVSVAGTGYVGLVSGVCLAEKGHQIICIDIDPVKVDKINQGIPPIYEDGLEDLLKKNIGQSLSATTNLRQAVLDTDISLIAVGTPFDGNEIDLKYIKTVARQIGEVIKDKTTYHTVVVKSTVVPGTTDEVVLPILEEASGKKAGVDFGVGMNPEFLKEGEAIEDFMYPDRIVYGGVNDKSIQVLQELYAVFEGVDQLATNCRTAEMIKYTANSLLATMISFSNEIANLCTSTGGIDVTEVTRGVHLDKRLTPILEDGTRIVPSFTTYIEAGCGFGGSCFPKDVKALIAYGKKQGNAMQILDSVIAVNEKQPARLITLLQKHYPDLKGVKVAVLGYAFKPGTDDIRESPALPVTQTLLDAGAVVQGYDPIAQHEAQKVFGEGTVNFCPDVDTAIAGAQAIIIITRWAEFKALPEMIASLEPQPVVIDGRRMLDKHSVAIYEGIGL